MPDSWDYSQKPVKPKETAPAAPILTFILFAISVIVTVAHTFPDLVGGSLWEQFSSFGFMSADEIRHGKYYGLVTGIFQHDNLLHGPLHLLFDMLWLVQLGRILEKTLNPLIYALFVIAAAAVSNAVQMAISGDVGIGMSGVVYALFGLMWGGRGSFPEWRATTTRQNLQTFIVWGIFCIFTTYTGLMSIANGAHFGGLLFGLAIGHLFFAPRRQPVWAIPLALVLSLGTYAVFIVR